MEGEHFFYIFNPPFLGYCKRCTAGDFPHFPPPDSQQNVCFSTLVFSISHLYFVILVNITMCKYADILPRRRIVVRIAENQWRKMKTEASFQLEVYSFTSLGQHFCQ